MDEELQKIITKLNAKGGPATEATLQRLADGMTGKKGSTAKDIQESQARLVQSTKKVESYLGEMGDEAEETSGSLKKLRAQGFASLDAGITIFTSGLNQMQGELHQLSYQFDGITGSVVRGLGSLIGMLSEQTDRFRELSSIGGAYGQGLDELRRLAGQTGLSMELLTDSAIQLGANLSLLGGSAAQGQQQFFRVVKELTAGDTFNNLSALGFTMKEITDNTAEYIELQTQLGRFQQMSAAQQTAGAQEYLMQLDLLTRLTGKNRQELQQEMQSRAKDTRLQLQLSGMTQKQAMEINSALSQTGAVSQQMEDSIKNLIATDGVATNAREAGILAIDGMREAIHSLARGETGSAQQLMKVFSNAAKETAAMSSEEKQRYAQLKQLGVDFFDVRFETIGFANAVKDVNEITKEQADALKTGKESALQFDKATMQLRNAFLGLLAPITGVLSKGIGALASGISSVAALFNDMNPVLKDVIGGLGVLVATLAGIKVAKGGIGLAKGLVSGIGGGGKGPGSYLPGGAGATGMMAGMGAGMKGLASGLVAFANPLVPLGAAAFGVSIAAIGAGIGAAVGAGLFLAGKGLESFGENLMAFQNIDGQNLKSVAGGVLALSGAMAAMGAGSTVGAVTGFFGKLFGGGPENFAKNINKTLDELDKNKIDMYANSLENLGNAMTSLRSGMTGTITASSSSTGDKLDRLNTTMEQILMVLGEGNRYSRITSKATTDTAENFG